MLEQIREHVLKGESFAFETTLSGLVYARHIPRWREQGYRVKLFFLRLPTPEMAIARVAQRVLEGGHDVPEAVLRRRFDAGRRNFEGIYRDLVDGWILYDNSGEVPELLAEESRGMSSQKENSRAKTSRSLTLQVLPMRRCAGRPNARRSERRKRLKWPRRRKEAPVRAKFRECAPGATRAGAAPARRSEAGHLDAGAGCYPVRLEWNIRVAFEPRGLLKNLGAGGFCSSSPALKTNPPYPPLSGGQEKAKPPLPRRGMHRQGDFIPPYSVGDIVFLYPPDKGG